MAIMEMTTSVAMMQVLRFCCHFASGTFCFSYVESFCCNYAGDLLNLSVAITQVTVSVAVMQVEVSAALYKR